MSTDFYQTSILPYAPIIIKICRAYTNSQEDFEDYYQEVCLQIWKSRNKFENKSEWSTWIYRLSLNVCLTLLKRQKKKDEKIQNREIPEHGIEADPFENEDLKMLYSAIKKLSEIDRALILLYLEEKSQKEIAEIIGLKPNNIGVRINRIKERLSKLIHE